MFLQNVTLCTRNLNTRLLCFSHAYKRRRENQIFGFFSGREQGLRTANISMVTALQENLGKSRNVVFELESSWVSFILFKNLVLSLIVLENSDNYTFC